MTAFDRLMKRQRDWARSHKVAMSTNNADYTVHSQDNLFCAPSKSCAAGLAAGTGGPMRGAQPDICALRSSTALAVNFFDYWASTSPSSIGGILGCGSATAIRYEVQYPKPSSVR